MSAPEYADIDTLVGNGAVDADDVELTGGRLVRVRGLTRIELLLNGKGTDDNALIEARNIETCMVAPPMSLEQAQRWQATGSAGDVGAVSNAIRRLSGLADGAAKSRVHADGARNA